MPPVHAVLFDYGMVLSGPPDPAAWARIRSLTGLSEDALHREYWNNRHAYDRGDLNAEAYWSKAASVAGIPLTPALLNNLTAADTDYWGQINSPMLDWVARLQRAGIPTGILSNMPDAMEAGLLTKHKWIRDFSHCTWSHSLNLAKPEPEIYHHAARGLRTPPANILFLDDRADNIAAALAVGMQAIQYTDHETFLDDMQARALTELLQPPSTV